MIGSLLDLLGRALIIERKDAMPWGFDPKVVESMQEQEKKINATPSPEEADGAKVEGPPAATTAHDVTSQSPRVTLLTVIWALGREPRAMITSTIVMFYG